MLVRTSTAMVIGVGAGVAHPVHRPACPLLQRSWARVRRARRTGPYFFSSVRTALTVPAITRFWVIVVPLTQKS